MGECGDEVVVGLDDAPDVPSFGTPFTAPFGEGSLLDWQERRLAVQNLGNIGPYAAAEVVPRLEEALQNEHWQVRREAANSLRKLGADAVKQALPALWDACSDSDNLVSAAAIQALQRHGQPLPHAVDYSERSAPVPDLGGKVVQRPRKEELCKEDSLTAASDSLAAAFAEDDPSDALSTTADALSTTDGGSSTQDFTVILGSETGHRGRLGIDIDFGHPAHLKIKKVNTGLVSDWNAGNPQKHVEIGDCFVEINGDTGCSNRLMELITTENKLIITVRRPDARGSLALEI